VPLVVVVGHVIVAVAVGQGLVIVLLETVVIRHRASPGVVSESRKRLPNPLAGQPRKGPRLNSSLAPPVRCRGNATLARTTIPPRRQLRRRRHQLLAVLRGGHRRRPLPLRRRRERGVRSPHRGHRAVLARLPAERRPGPTPRLPNPLP